MKHLCLLFAFFLFLSPGVCAAESGTTPLVNYEVWEIPWDITMEEFIQIAKKNTGIVFEPAANSEGVIDRCAAKSGQDITMLGLPVVEIRAYFVNETATYSNLSVDFSIFMDQIASIEEIPPLYLSLRKQLLQKYGNPTNEHVLVDYKDELLAFDFPMANNTFYTEEFFLMIEDSWTVWMNTYFSNILLSDLIRPDKRYHTYRHSLFLSASYPTKNPNLPNGEIIGNYTEYRKTHPLTNIPPPISVGF